MGEYEQFIANKQQLGEESGFDAVLVPDFLYEFQKMLVIWAVRKGRAAIFADCGMGKTPMQLIWAQNVIEHTNRPVLLLTPLAVGPQTIAEAEKFGVDAVRSRDGKHDGTARVVVTNYEQLHKFDQNDFSGVVCDESSAIKSFKSERKAVVTEFMRQIKYRLLCTATAAPNDFWEVGTSSEALGYLGYQDMLSTFFKQETQKDYLGWGRSKFRFRGHAEMHFWRWLCSWARAIRRPLDFGFEDEDEEFQLPPLNEIEHVVDTAQARDGMLFSMPARDLREQREERRLSLEERCEMAAELATTNGATVLWCELNDEGDRLTKMIDGAQQVKGSMSDDKKEEVLTAFSRGELKYLVTKPKIGCWGLNWQHCHNVVMFPSHSFEQFYQAVRRCWRFGQQNPVDVHLVVNEGELGVLKNIQRKAAQCDRMFTELLHHMNDALRINSLDVFPETEKLPAWV